MIISILLGIIVSVLFFYYVKQRDIIVIRGDSITNINNSNIKKDGKCYNIIAEQTECSI